MTVHFSDPPEVSAAERAVYSGLRGKADLTCIVKAEPRANVSIYKNLESNLNYKIEAYHYQTAIQYADIFQVTWYLEGRPVKLDMRHFVEGHGSLVMLRIKNIDILDLGNYSCQAENSQGISRDHIELSGKMIMNFLEIIRYVKIGFLSSKYKNVL